MSGNKLSEGRTGYVMPERLHELSWSDRNRIVNAHRGRMVTDLDRDDDVHIARSLQRTSDRIDYALAVHCSDHEAEPGAYCIGSSSSGVRGLCRARYAAGVTAAARRNIRHPEEQEPLAQAERYARRVDRIREHNAAPAGVGASIRMHVGKEVSR